MNILELQVNNFKRIRAITIRPDGPAVLVSGRNAQGKSSTLDAIMAALGGGRMCPGDPIRHGEKEAEVRLDLGDLVVCRKFTADGSHLEVTTRDGAPVKRPQQMLDELTGALTFDPLAFTRKTSKQQAEALRELAGLDLSELDAQIDALFEQRKDASRDARRLQGAADSAKLEKGAPIDLIVVSELVAELSRRQAHNDARRDLEKQIDKTRRAAAKSSEQHISEIEKSKSEAERLEAKIFDLKEQAAFHRQKIAELEKANKESVRGWAEALQAFEERFRMGHWEDIAEMQTQIENAEALNMKARANMEAMAKRKAAAKAQADADELTRKLEGARDERRRRIEAASFPVDGLSLDENGVRFRGVPFEQASGAEKIRISAAIGLAMNPGIRILLVRDASLLDDEALEALKELAAKHGAQVWLERVGGHDSCAIIIEDGEVLR